MAERYLLALNTLRTPHHDPGVQFDVAAIVLRVVAPERSPQPPVLDIGGGFLVPTTRGPEVVYPRGLAGFDSVSRAVAYNHQFNHRAVSRDDTLVVLGHPDLAFAWEWDVRTCKVRSLKVSYQRGAQLWENASSRAEPLEVAAAPGARFSEAEQERLRGELLDWSLPRPPRW